MRRSGSQVRCYSFIVSIDGSLDAFGAVVGFETSDNALVLRLDMRSEIWLEVFDMYALEILVWRYPPSAKDLGVNAPRAQWKWRPSISPGFVRSNEWISTTLHEPYPKELHKTWYYAIYHSSSLYPPGSDELQHSFNPLQPPKRILSNSTWNSHCPSTPITRYTSLAVCVEKGSGAQGRSSRNRWYRLSWFGEWWRLDHPILTWKTPDRMTTSGSLKAIHPSSLRLNPLHTKSNIPILSIHTS